MILSADEVEQFYRIWFPLLHFVNQRLKLVKSFPSTWPDASVQPSKAYKLREALWGDDSLREAFIRENPAGLAQDDLDLVASWTYRIPGKFYVFRYLKKYTVFLLEGKPPRAYGVLGLVSPIEDVLGPVLPIFVEAVLLPFGDRIIYDSLISSYPIFFGPGIRAELDDTYRDAQESLGIITSLPPTSEQIRRRPQMQQKKVLSAFQKELGHAGLSPKMIAQHVSNMELLAQSMRSAGDPLRGLLDLDLSDIDAYLSRPDANPVSLKRFITFLRDTARFGYGRAEDLLDFLKSRRKEG